MFRFSVPLALAAALPAFGEAPPPAPPADAAALAAGNAAFAVDLYTAVAAGAGGNVVLSPHSVSEALALTYAGARGRTADEMAKVLHFALPQERLHPAVADLSRRLRTSAAATNRFEVANALWGQRGVPFEPEFLKLASRSYGGGFRETDFARANAAAVREINGWVGKKTQGKINELLKPGDVPADTRMALANAVYFLGQWDAPFRKERTRDEEFEPVAGPKVKVPMMHAGGRFLYQQADGAQWVELPYRGGALSMVVVLPTERDGLAAFERGLTAERLTAGLRGLRRAEGSVALPRFRFQSRFSLKDRLAALGMPTAFSDAADFTGIGKALAIGDVIHAGDVAVDEQGTEAAAATAVTIMPTSAPVDPPAPFDFRADHPFFFVIRDRASGAMLFAGRYAGPG